MLEVRVEDRGRYRILMPCEEEADAIASAGKPVPRLIEGDLRAAREELRCLAGPGGASGQVAVGRGAHGTKGTHGGDETASFCGAELVMRARGMTVVAMPGDGDLASLGVKGLKREGGERTEAEGMEGTDATVGSEERDRDLTNWELCEHLDGRLDNLGQEQACLRRENVELKENLAGVLAGAAKKVDPEFFRSMFAVLGAGSVSGGAKTLGMPNSTLVGKLRGFAGRGGIYRTLYDMIDVRRKLGVRSVERFNESFASHQGLDCGQVDVLRDLLDGLEAMDDGNWGAVRDELLVLVKEGNP
jgi:hypothetical protein